MPYIKSDDDRRKKLQSGDIAKNAGELNYQIFFHVKHTPLRTKFLKLTEKHIKKFIKQYLGNKPNYQKYNDVTGVCIRCYREIKRRIGINFKPLLLTILNSYDEEIANYEDKKIQENGDVK